MKNRIMKITAAVLCFSLLLSIGAYAVFPTNLLKHSGTTLASGVTLSSNTYWKDSFSDKVIENYITYTPNQTVKPVVVYGSKVCNYGNFVDMAQLMEKRGYSVIAGINGDYYNMDTFQPLGIVITDGMLKSSDDAHYAVGFKADGTAIMGSPALNMNLTVGDSTYLIYGINKVRTGDGFFLFTEDFSYTTKSKDSGSEVICSLVKGNLTVNSQLTLSVDSVIKDTGPVDIPAGKIVLSLSDKTNAQDVLKKFAPGTQVTVRVGCADTRWNSVQYAVGSLYKLVTAGKIESGLEAGIGPRTAVGIKANGEMVLYTVDGRQQGYSMGATMQEVAERLLALGCTEATLMDGGGSTTLGSKFIGDSDYTVINSPSDGRMRNVTEFIMLAAAGTGNASIMGVYPYNALMLTGTEKTFRVGTADKYGNAKPTGSVNWSLASGTGQVSSSGVFKAAGAGEAVIKASSGDLNATASITVIDAPDSIAVYDEGTGNELSSVTVEAGQSLNLTAKAVYKQMNIDLSDTDFKWKLSDNIGTVDANGIITAGLYAGTGTLTVIAGSKVTYIPVTVKVKISKLEDFEGGSLKLSGTPKNASAVLNTDMEKVRFGKQSADIKYDLKNVDASVPISLTLPKNNSYVSVWVYGDGSGNSLMLGTLKGNTPPVILDFTGWKQLVLPVSSDVTGILISGKGSGELWIDHITSSVPPVMDTAAPTISMSGIKNGVLTAGVWDDYDGSVFYYNVSVYCDGKALQYDYQYGQLQSLLPALDSKVSHRVTVNASDMSGNQSRTSLDIPAANPAKAVFSDMGGHWADKYVSYLYNMGIVSGVSINNKLSYNPDEEMSREQFAVIMARYLGTDLTKYSEIKLSFADLKDISDYALPSVKAMYALGVIKGVIDENQLCFKPKDSLTRAQAITIIGRTLPAGYLADDLTKFSDASEIPDWSINYVRTLTSLGIISGSGDMLTPNNSVTRAEVAKIITMLY